MSERRIAVRHFALRFGLIVAVALATVAPHQAGAVGAKPSSTSLGPFGGISSVDQIPFGVDVTAAAGAQGTPTGTIDLQLDGPIHESWSGQLSGGAFSGTLGPLPAGNYMLTASYPGDSTFAPSSSCCVSLSVDLTATLTHIDSPQRLGPSCCPPPIGVPAGSPVTLTATVGTGFANNPTGVSATGTMTFSLAHSTTLATVAFTGGTATFTTSNLPPGDNYITAHYNGDAYLQASDSESSTFVSDQGVHVLVGSGQQPPPPPASSASPAGITTSAPDTGNPPAATTTPSATPIPAPTSTITPTTVEPASRQQAALAIHTPTDSSGGHVPFWLFVIIGLAAIALLVTWRVVLRLRNAAR